MVEFEKNFHGVYDCYDEYMNDVLDKIDDIFINGLDVDAMLNSMIAATEEFENNEQYARELVEC